MRGAVKSDKRAAPERLARKGSSIDAACGGFCLREAHEFWCRPRRGESGGHAGCVSL
jgi:hypothetical protein